MTPDTASQETIPSDNRPRYSEANFTQPHTECPEPHLWSAPDDASAEDEVTLFLRALVSLLKPRVVVETGTFHGFTTAALAEALRKNGRGHVTSLELEPEPAAVARERLARADLSQTATVVVTSSLEWIPPDPIDFLFLDAGAGWHRASEYLHFRPYMHTGTVVAVHDTAWKNRLPRQSFQALAGMGMLSPVWFSTPRGLLLAQPRWPSVARRAVGVPYYATVRTYSAVRSSAARLRGGRHRG
jgi:predicted O-methyltransferase YrrM